MQQADMSNVCQARFRPPARAACLLRFEPGRRALSPHALLVLLGCLVLLAASGPVQATRDFMAAGVLLVAHEGDSAFVFLGRSRYRAWYEALAGRREVVASASGEQVRRQETAYETALRECFEESRGFLRPELLRDITDRTRFIRDGAIVLFFANIEKFLIADLMASPLPPGGGAFAEIADYAWVPVDHVLASGDEWVDDDTGRRILVRKELKSRLIRARQAGWI